MNKKRVIIIEVFFLCASLGLMGCYKPVKYPELDPALIPTRQFTAGVSVEKRPVEYHVIGRGPEVIFIMAGIHGDEPAGIPIVKQLTEYLQQSRQGFLNGRTVVLLPVANPDGIAKNTRYNANGVDLNRNFAAQNRINNEEFGLTPLSEPEAYIIRQIIRQYKPERIGNTIECIGTAKRFNYFYLESQDLIYFVSDRRDYSSAALHKSLGFICVIIILNIKCAVEDSLGRGTYGLNVGLITNLG